MSSGQFVPGIDDERPRPGAEHGPSLLCEQEGEAAPRTAVLGVLASRERLRAASAGFAALPQQVRVEALARVARAWLDDCDPLRVAALEVLPEEWGHTRQWVEEAIGNSFSTWTVEALGGWVPALSRATREPSAHLWPSSVGIAGLPPLAATLLAGRPVLVKAPAAQPTFAAAVARSFAWHAPELGPCFAAVPFERSDDRARHALLRGLDRVVVFGDGATVAAVREAADPSARVSAFGPKLSIGVIGSEDPTDAAIDGLLWDTFAWDGAGCLCPRWTFVLGDLARARALATRVVRAAREFEGTRRHRTLDPAEGNHRVRFLDTMALCGWVRSGPGWAVAVARDLEPCLDVPARACVLVPVESPRAARELLSPWGPILQGVATVGGVEVEPWARELGPLGLTRIAEAGSLQKPPLRWAHDGVRWDLLG